MDFPALERVGLDKLFSELGRRIYLPQGIFYWLGRGKKEAKPGLNATIGSAFVPKSLLYDGEDDSEVIAHLPQAARMFSTLGPGAVFPYAPICGTPEFREAWRNWTIFKGGEEYADVREQLTLPIAVPGITGAIYYAVKLFLDPGDRIICPVQRWENYDTVISQNLGVDFEEYPHFARGEFNIEGFIAAVDKTLKKNAKAVAIVNFPNNPTGYNPTATLIRDQLLPAVCECVQRHDKPLVMLFDDAYEGYVYDNDSIKVSAFYEFLNADDRIIPIKLDGVSKEMLWYGGRIGCITLGVCDEWLNETSVEDLTKDLENKIGAMVRGSVSNSPHVVQSAIAKLLADPGALTAARKPTVDILRERWQALQKAVKALPSRVWPDPYQGGFFLFLNLDGVSATAVAEHLLAKHGVAVVPAEIPERGINGLRLAYCGIAEANIPVVIDAIAQSVEAVKRGA